MICWALVSDMLGPCVVDAFIVVNTVVIVPLVVAAVVVTVGVIWLMTILNFKQL